MQAKVLTKDEARRHFPDPPIAQILDPSSS
jgi:hypothetical protein